MTQIVTGGTLGRLKLSATDGALDTVERHYEFIPCLMQIRDPLEKGNLHNDLMP